MKPPIAKMPILSSPTSGKPPPYLHMVEVGPFTYRHGAVHSLGDLVVAFAIDQKAVVQPGDVGGERSMISSSSTLKAP